MFLYKALNNLGKNYIKEERCELEIRDIVKPINFNKDSRLGIKEPEG
jgi:hypothetical protein